MLDIRKLLCNWLDCCEEFKKEIKRLGLSKETYKRLLNQCEVERGAAMKKLEEKDNKIQELILDLHSANAQIEDLKQEIEELRQNIHKIPPYKGKHTEAEITYRRYMLVGKNEIRQFKIDVRHFIMPNNFEIYNDIERNNLFVEDTENLNEVVPKLYYLAKKRYKYRYDSVQFGMSEVWLFPFELLQLLKLGMAGDCEDWAHLIGSYFACAGVPRDRWWISCGYCKGVNGGHSTVYVKDDSGIWRHLNSTSPYPKNAKSLEDFPDKDDPKDSLGIGDFWFSFNDYWSISDFTTNAKKSFKREKAMKNVNIKWKKLK